MNYSSPNRMVWQYFDALRRHIEKLSQESKSDHLKQNVALSIMLSVTVVEAFMNIFFRVVVSEQGFTKHANKIISDLNERKSLDHKLKKWPKIVFGKELSGGENSALTAFMDLKDQRNKLMHFSSTHTTLTFENFEIHGACDTSVFDMLTIKDAHNAIKIAEEMVREFCRLRGINEKDLDHSIHLWLGKVPV